MIDSSAQEGDFLWASNTTQTLIIPATGSGSGHGVEWNRYHASRRGDVLVTWRGFWYRRRLSRRYRYIDLSPLPNWRRQSVSIIAGHAETLTGRTRY